ncbi:hypothetical protein F4809DRAFT_616917 [Biscogniauxia mediterranea]|nr:hypothetical protein F4809DRAFT_616917 [Biscogniauxia mediterranea]
MGSKRAAAGDDSEKPAKRPRENASSRAKKSKLDPNYGQRGVFGDLQDATTVPMGDSDLDCEDDAEALAYLRSVRIQASSIPHVVVAKKAGPPLPPRISENSEHDGEAETGEFIDRSIYQDGLGDFRGYYHDGAYTAYPENYFDEDDDDDDEEEEEEEENEEEDGEYEEGQEHEGMPNYDDYDEEYSPGSSDNGPHNSSVDEIRDAYFTSLIDQYVSLRRKLQTKPPSEVLQALPVSHPTDVMGYSGGAPLSRAFARWAGRLKNTDPLPAQVAAMHKDSVVQLLRVILGGKFLQKDRELSERTSRWLWALLARLPDKGELDYRDIGWVRELGKRAVLLLVSLAEFEVLKENYEVGACGGSNDDSQWEAEAEAEMDVLEGVDEELSEGTPKEEYDNPTGPEPEGPEVKEITAQSTLPKPELEDASDVEMQIESDAEEGEVSDAEPSPQSLSQQQPADDIEAAKARLLAQLADTASTDNHHKDSNDANSSSPSRSGPTKSEEVDAKEEGEVGHANYRTDEEAVAEEVEQKEEEEEEEQESEAARRARINERATLNMILTVAGEFYGQRDLLEFRDPFGSF